jgi:hypothetical protein
VPAEDVREVTQTNEKPWAGKSPGYRFGGAGPGRPKGRKNNAMLAVEEFAREVVHSQEYRDSVMRRIEADTLHPSVEISLHHFAAGGKPTERVEVKDTTDGIDLSVDELQARSMAVAKSLLALRESHDDESLATH